LAVKINGNRGTQQEICFNKVSKEIVLFQQEFPFLECNAKNDPIEHPEWGSDQKIRLRLPALSEIRLRLHPKTSDFLRLRLHNPATYHKC